jgi:Flp pilus assembly protein TadG
MVIFAVALFAMAGLVIDGGLALDARGRAVDVAQQAARAGAGAISPDSLRGRSPDLRVDVTVATQQAKRVLTLAGATGEVSVLGDTVTVTAHIRQRAVLLAAFGVNELTASADATATVLHGTTTGRTR